MLPEKLAGKFVCRGSGIVQKCRVMGQGSSLQGSIPEHCRNGGVCVWGCMLIMLVQAGQKFKVTFKHIASSKPASTR